MTITTAIDRPKEKLYVTDEELIRLIGVPPKEAREAIRMLDRDRRSGFPQKSKLWGDRRYWPAVKAYFDATNRTNITTDAARLIPESRDRTRLPRRTLAELPAERHYERTPED